MDDVIPNIENDRRKPGRRCERGFDSGRGLQPGERLRGLSSEPLIGSLSEEQAAGLRELLERRRTGRIRLDKEQPLGCGHACASGPVRRAGDRPAWRQTRRILFELEQLVSRDVGDQETERLPGDVPTQNRPLNGFWNLFRLVGIHWATWKGWVDRFGWSPCRRGLLNGLRRVLRMLREAGCTVVYVNGSFVTAKETPGDFEACWDVDGVDLKRLAPVFLDFCRQPCRAEETVRWRTVSCTTARRDYWPYVLGVFPNGPTDGSAKGIVAIRLEDLRR